MQSTINQVLPICVHFPSNLMKAQIVLIYLGKSTFTLSDDLISRQDYIDIKDVGTFGRAY